MPLDDASKTEARLLVEMMNTARRQYGYLEDSSLQLVPVYESQVDKWIHPCFYEQGVVPLNNVYSEGVPLQYALLRCEDACLRFRFKALGLVVVTEVAAVVVVHAMGKRTRQRTACSAATDVSV